MREMYARHPGPYSLVITSVVGTKKIQSVLKSGDAQATHELARTTLADDPKVEAIDVYSDREGQYLGLEYRRGEQYQPWDELPGLDVAPVREEGAPLPAERPEPVRPVAPAAEPAREPDRSPARAPRVRRVSQRLRATEGIAPWPDGDAQLVRALVPEGSSGLTPAEICSELVGKTKCKVVASLVSRLKQAGLLEIVS